MGHKTPPPMILAPGRASGGEGTTTEEVSLKTIRLNSGHNSNDPYM
jgi:hypothetical protein